MKRYFILLLLLLLTSCNHECKPSGRYLVVTPWAGMANRLRTLASAKIMAAITDRELIVDWKVLPNELPGTWKDFFNNSLTTFERSALPSEGCTYKVITTAWKGDPIIKNMGVQNSPELQKNLNNIPE